MKKEPLVSVIVPIYNVEKYLHKCLNSILKQTYQNLEIILVDDGATDKSGKIADEYAKKDARIIVIHKKNGGQSSARNQGIRRATGDYISFIDGDDEIDKDFYVNLQSVMCKKCMLAVCGMHYRKLALKTENDVYVKSLRARRKNESLESYVTFLLTIDGRMYSSVNKLFCADIIRDKALFFDERINFAEDTKFVLNYLKGESDKKIIFINKPLYIYNFGTDGSTMRRTSIDWKNWQRSYIDLKKFVGTKNGIMGKFWLFMVLLRWRVSYILSKYNVH